MSGIMPRGTRQLLLPASPFFIWASLFLALLLNMAQSFLVLGRASWCPDWLLIILVFWSTHQPQRVGMGAAFFFGFLMDIHQTALLGQHALSYTLVSFFAITLHNRILWFKTTTQALQLLPVFALTHSIDLLMRLGFGNDWPDWGLLFAPMLESFFWPIVSFLLLLPQRRSPDPDVHRPL